MVSLKPPLNISFLKTTPIARRLIGARAVVRAEARRLRVGRTAEPIHASRKAHRERMV